MARFATLTIVCGRRGTGKTNKTLRQIYKSVAGDPKRGIKGRKALIYDVTDEFGSYPYRIGEPPHSIAPIFFKNIPRFSAQKFPELRRTRPLMDDGKKMSYEDMQGQLDFILDNYSNGTLLAEDINVYLAPNAPQKVTGKLSTLRQRGVDLILQYQSIGKASNPQILAQANYIRIHKTNDSVLNYADKFLEKTNMLVIAQSIVNKRYSEGSTKGIKDETGIYFNVTVDLFNDKIKGAFSRAEAEDAIQRYLSANASSTVKREFNSVDRNNKRIYTDYSAAYSVIEQQMLDDFFDFTSKK